MEIKRSVTNKRAVLLLGIVIILFSVLLGRIVYIQTTKEVNGQDLQVLAQERWTRSEVIEGIRGTIYDRSGSALAQELKSYTVFAVLDQTQTNFVDDVEETAVKLAPLINMPEEQLRKALLTGQEEGKFQIELGSGARNLTHEQATDIRNLQLRGIHFRDEPRRYYPKQTYASHVIGYTERDMGEARMGLERSLNDLLTAENGLLHYQSDRRGIPLPNPNQHITPAKNGHDVYLTLDSNIQTALEQVMTQVEMEFEPEKMIAIVADPKTGEILAMSNRPSFNPNQYEQITNYLNFAISDRFEPGSTMKIFTVAAAIEEGVYNGQEHYRSGSIEIADRTIRDHNDARGWGEITYDEGFLRSSNVAMSKLALEKLGVEKLYDYLHRFGFDSVTGIDLPNEANSLLARNGRIDAATTAFGQGSAVTPIQQIQAATAIANDGKMMKPYIVDRIVDKETNKVISKNEPEVVGEPISKQTAEQVKDLLEQVVTSSAGTGTPYYIEGFDVAGKTGTAQIRDPNAPGYLQGHGKNIFSFLGMAPKEDPRLVVYVAVERPKIDLTETGSIPTSMIFNTIMKHSLQYLNISPNAENKMTNVEKQFETKDYAKTTIAKVKDDLNGKEIELVLLGDGDKIEAQQPQAGRALLPGERLFIRTNSESYKMPDLTGWSNRDVRRFAQVLELSPTFFGNGYVKTQSIDPGTKIEKGDYLIIELEMTESTEEVKIDEEIEQTVE
ncbi:penicillin-binding transpeptidase domain-containing protein [Halalkalibacter akibai]|uniref:serine-type D-Ala-D-Ala carboxypeptidase n=1 Tax=Halalkalibacter akibai (strain ATCC 43226 / DSM 21942 / CIP 109018 / JCM 9157 / 1139) TaxID=1236973 RepID=W4QP45_HALA3|nr:penicillin-binding transpeptidase domain-containing protein [Halalkalibacter akibai]GAE33851.1 penicillin-binding protein 2B [Halalkalibacter akibai JCM 9157]